MFADTTYADNYFEDSFTESLKFFITHGLKTLQVIILKNKKNTTKS